MAGAPEAEVLGAGLAAGSVTILASLPVFGSATAFGSAGCFGSTIVLDSTVAFGSVVAGANLAVQSRDWSSQRIVRELRPLVTAACDDISAILGFAG